MMIQPKFELIRKTILVTASCAAITLIHAAVSPANAQDNDALLQEVQAMLRKPLPTPPEGVTLPPGKSDEELARELSAMLFDNEAAGQVKPLAAVPAGVGTTQSESSPVSGSQAAAGNPLAGQIRVELPPAPPEKYAPTTAAAPIAPQARRPAALPDPAVFPLPPHPPESQAPSVQPRPPASPPVHTPPAQRPVQLPDPTIIPLPPHPPEDQAPWRQGV